jgi:hypothetical protein
MKKKMVVGAVLVLLVGLVGSCVSIQDRTMSLQERNENEIIGSVSVEFTAYNFFHIPNKASLKNKAYMELKKAAMEKYGANIEIANIVLSGSWSGLELLSILGYSVGVAGGGYISGAAVKPEIGIPVALGVIGLSGNAQKITAIADVIKYNATAAQTQRTQTNIEGALERAAQQTLQNIPKRSRIAIVYITSLDRSTTDYIAGELEFIWVNQGYIITDRTQLDRIRREQNFQISGEVDDETAVSIGKFIGADIIVTGRVDGEGNLRRLRLRALNTQTAQVVGAASERL